MAPSREPALSLPERRTTNCQQYRQSASARSDSEQEWPQSNSRSCGKHSGQGGTWDDAGELNLTEQEWKDWKGQLDKQQDTVGWSGILE